MKLLGYSIKYTHILFFSVFVILLVVFQDADLHLKLNSYNSATFDVFFKYITYFGDGVLFPVFIIGFLFINKIESLKFVCASLLTLIITFVLKKKIFKGYPRPVEFFGESKLHLVEGVDMHHWNSFPSGHSMAAFAMFVLLSFYLKNPVLKISAVVVAFLAAISRVYLSQHFMIDIIVGGAVGTGIAICSEYLGKKLSQRYLKKRRK